MRGKTFRGAGLLALWLALAPAVAWAQLPAVPGTQPPTGPLPQPPAAASPQAPAVASPQAAAVVRAQAPGGEPPSGATGDATGYAPSDHWGLLQWNPLGSTRPEDGGLFMAYSFLMLRPSNPLKDQLVAVRGFIATDDSVPGTPTNSSGVFIGSRTEALNTKQVSGPQSYVPGFEAAIGWKFNDASALYVNWMHMANTKYTAVASGASPPGLNVRGDLADSFITAYVYNFPPDFSGPTPTIQGASPTATYGIWDGAAVMTEEFRQRIDKYELLYRLPVYEDECYRLSGLVGARCFWWWERYQWRTVKLAADGSGGALEDQALYTNIVSNRMYGSVIGCSNEYYLGHGFACQLDLKAALYLDSVKEEAKYWRADRYFGTENKRARIDYTIVPEVEALLGVMWYPMENVQIMGGYNLFVFFNTISSQRPIDFNYSSLNPAYDRTLRTLDGWQASLAIHF